MNNMFNLEQAIAEWRRQMLAAGLQTPVPLDELESHLRDEIGRQVQSGVSEPAAFDAAVREIGPAGSLQWEFAKAAGIGSPAVALVYGVLLAGLIIASSVDFKHFMIPDEITLGGCLLGLLCSALVPQLHGQKLLLAGMLQSLLGLGLGAGLLYLILRAGKLAFGRQRLPVTSDTKVIFTDTTLLLPDREIPYGELFYRRSDAIELQARTVQFAGTSYQDVPIRLTPTSLQIGGDKFNPKLVPGLEAVSWEVVLPREAMGLGDVKLMAAIGAFLGWPAVIFSLMVSSLIGSLVGMGLVAARRREWSSRLPFGPFLALAAAGWIFGGKQLFEAVFAR
jgi:leader peptidase (prepilin peptidase)/N-methyltransferase